jgi:serine/threonine protein kinase
MDKEMILLDPSNGSQQTFFDLLQTLLRYDPDERPSAEQALKHAFFSMEIHEDEVQLESPK